MRWLGELRSQPGDGPQLTRARRRARIWLALNASVIGVPVFFRGMMIIFIGSQEDFRILQLEEFFLFSFFLNASASADLWDHIRSRSASLEAKINRVLGGLLLSGFILAFLYGIAFSGVATLETKQLVVLGIVMAGSILSALRAQMLVVEEIRVTG